MADIIETTASIEELDVNPNPSESASHLEQKQEHGFSAEQLRTDIDYANLEQVTQERLEEKGISVIVPEPNSKFVVMGQIESILTEVLHYKAIQRYKDKITPEFIAVFNEAEQEVLRELVDVLDQYLVLQKKYVTELLQLLDYEDIDAFFVDITAIPAVAPAILADSSDLDLAAKLAKVIGPKRLPIISFLAQKAQAGGPIDLNVPNKISIPYLKLAKQAIAASANSDLPAQLLALASRFDTMEQHYSASKSQHHAEKRAAFSQAKDDKSIPSLSSLIVKLLTNERALKFSDMAKSLSDEWMLEPEAGVEEVSASKYIDDIRLDAIKVSIKLNEAERQISSRPIQLPQDEVENLEDKKIKRRRTRRLTQRLTQMFSKEVADLFRAPASDEFAKPKVLDAKPESVSPEPVLENSIPVLKVTTAVEAMDVSASSVPELKVTQVAEKPDVSALSMPEFKATQATEKPDLRVSSSPELKVTPVAEKTDLNVSSSPELKVTPAAKMDISVSARSELKRSASESQLKKPQLARKSSIEKLSAMLGEVVEVTATKFDSVKGTINRFSGKLTKLGAAISFSDYVGTALHSVQIFQGIAKDKVAKAEADRTKFENWQFIYKRKANSQADEKEESFEGKIPTNSRDGDFAEIRHNGHLICDIVAQKVSGDAGNIASGVAVTVHRHEEEDIDLAVHMMVQSLAKVGKKKIIVTADLNSPEGGELALRYVKAILRQNAIPVFFDGDTELSAKETKAKIEELYSLYIIGTKENSIYKHAAEQYEETAKKIKREQKEDAIFIKAFKKLMETPVTTSRLFMQDPNPPKDTLIIEEIARKLGDIALVRRNLTLDDYVDKLVDCLRKNYAKDYESLTSDELYKIKREVKDYFACKIAKNRDILNDYGLLVALKAEIFDRSLRKLQDSLFLPAFDSFLWDIALPSAIEIKMQDPSTGDELDAHQILTRLAQIAFVRNGMEPEEFIDRVLAFGMGTLAPSARSAVTDQDMDDLKKELQEKIRLHLLHPVDKRDEAKFAADLIKFAQHELLPGHVAEDSRNYGMFAMKGSSCAAFMRKEKEEVVSPQPVQVMVN